MPYLFKLSKRVARTRSRALILAAAAVFACEPGDPSMSGPEGPSYATADGKPASVTDLAVSAVTDTSATLSFTEADDGTGRPATYDIRYALAPISWGSAPSVARGTCAVPASGGAIGAKRSCTVLGLSPASGYQFQLVAFRGTLNVDAVFGALSNVASGATSVGTPVPAAVLVQEGFEDGSFASRGWYDNTGMATTTAQDVSGSRALEVHFVAGGKTPTWGGAARHLFKESESVYLSYWVKYSANWVGSGRSYHPHEFLFLTNENDVYSGLSFTHLTAYVEHSYQNGGIPVLQLQDGQNVDQSGIGVDLSGVTESRAAAGCNGNADGYATNCYNQGDGKYTNEKKFSAGQPSFMPNPGPGYKGDWHFVEAYFKLNAIQSGKGVANGIVRYWFDGRLVIERTNVLMRTGAHAGMKFNQLAVAPWIGDGSPVDQTMWADNLTVATDRVAGWGTVPAPVASVTVTPGSVSQTIGGTQQFTATLKDASGNVVTGRSVAWTSSAPAVATVSGSGLETGVAAGSATITATSEGVSGVAKVTVIAPVASVSLSPATVSQKPGGTQQFTATLKDASGNVLSGRAVAWASSNGVVATVSGSGLETAIAIGSSTITATSEGKSGVAKVTVIAPVASVSLSPATVSQNPGATQQLTATLKDASGNVLTGRSVTWTSSAPAVATVNTNGLETAVATGSATITATSEGRTGTAVVTVAAPIITKPGSVADLAVAGVSDTSVTLSFTEVTGGTGQPAKYDVRYAVSPLLWGSALAVSRGTCATPLAGSAVGAKRTCTVLGLSRTTLYGFQLVAFRGTLNVDAVFGGLSNVATGTTAARAPAPVASVTVTPASVSQSIGGTQQFTATLKDASGNMVTGRSVTWTSSAPAVATVSGSALETGVAAGSATITAMSEGKSGTTLVTVTLPTITKPGTVSNLTVAGATASSVTLSFTEVSGGAGQPASYDVRSAPSPISWGSATSVATGTCATPLHGSTIGAQRTCTVQG
ncbi:MAG TPA: Ig-like domain-containing protein, partial [Gemmatimonadales bacterium]|nr:Ig-like domain-containing protein [Gemmatimonadales bacterium]